MAGRVPSNSWASVVPVAGAVVGAVVLDGRAISNSWVPVDPVVGGMVGAVVVRPRAMSHSWELVGLVGGVRLTLAVGDVGLVVGPADGSRGSVVRLPKADHQAHNERHRRCCSSQSGIFYSIFLIFFLGLGWGWFLRISFCGLLLSVPGLVWGVGPLICGIGHVSGVLAWV